MGLFFFRKEVNRFEFAQRLDEVDDKLQQLENQQIQIAKQISILQDTLTRIERAKAIEKAHENHPSLEQRMNKGKTRYDRKSKYETKQFKEHFIVAKYLKNIGMSYLDIAAKMNELGYLSARQQRYSIHAISDLLNNRKQIRNYEDNKDLAKAIELIDSKSKYIWANQSNQKINGNAGQIGLNSGYVPPF